MCASVMNVIDLVAAYQTSERNIVVVDRLNLSLPKTGIIGIAGESGCGKTTLIKVLYGLIEPPLKVLSGDVLIRPDNENALSLLKMSEKEINRLRWRFFSYIPQASMSVLNPVMRIEDQFFDQMVGEKVGKSELRKQLSEYLNRMGLPHEVLRSYPHQLSGGMRQRVIIIMALLFQPRIIFADEPTTALDVVVQRGILEMMRDAQRSLKNLLVVVTHDMGMHYQISDFMVMMYSGKIVETGNAEEIFKDPLHPYTKMLISSLPRIGDKLKREGIKGSPPSFYNLPQGCRFHPRCPYAVPICRKEEPPVVNINNRSVSCHIIG